MPLVLDDRMKRRRSDGKESDGCIRSRMLVEVERRRKLGDDLALLLVPFCPCPSRCLLVEHPESPDHDLYYLCSCPSDSHRPCSLESSCPSPYGRRPFSCEVEGKETDLGERTKTSGEIACFFWRTNTTKDPENESEAFRESRERRGKKGGKGEMWLRFDLRKERSKERAHLSFPSNADNLTPKSQLFKSER